MGHIDRNVILARSRAVHPDGFVLLHQDLQMEHLDLCETFSGKGVTCLEF